jgi:hypothetical protein
MRSGRNIAKEWLLVDKAIKMVVRTLSRHRRDLPLQVVLARRRPVIGEKMGSLYFGQVFVSSDCVCGRAQKPNQGVVSETQG